VSSDGSVAPAADLSVREQKKDPFDVVARRCLQIAGPATEEDIEDLVDAEVDRLKVAAAKAEHPPVYLMRCLSGYEPPESLIKALQARRDRVRAGLYGERGEPDHEGTPERLSVGRPMPDPQIPH
jgi:hypothetical protein